MAITSKRVNWILDADIEGFFDAIDHGWLVKFLEHRIGDRRILRLIQKWLRAGVSAGGEWSKTTVGAPQGSVISPLLSNVYLHYVFDLWIEWWRKDRCRGDVVVVRYADDFQIFVRNVRSAQRVFASVQRYLTQRLKLVVNEPELLVSEDAADWLGVRTSHRMA